MTTNKPEVVAYRYTASRSFGKRNRKWHYQESFPHAANREVAEIGQMEELIRLSDYERLQAKLIELEEDYATLAEERDHIGRNSSAFENRMGELQIANGKLKDKYEALQADRDQQYDMKVKAREQRDAVTAKLDALQAECENLRKTNSELAGLSYNLTVELYELRKDAERLEKSQRDLLEAVDSMRGTCGVRYGNTPLDEYIYTHDKWAEDFLKERAEAARAAIDTAMETAK